MARNALNASLLLSVTLAFVALAAAGQSSKPGRASNPAIQTHFAAAQQAQGAQDWPAAEREYRAVLALAPSFAEVHMNLGLVYQLQNRVPEAMAEFQRALKLKPALAGANFFLGVDYCKTGEGVKAIPYLQAALRAEPHPMEAWSWLATAQEISGQISEEVVTLARGLKEHPRDVDLLYLLGHAYERLGKREVAQLDRSEPGSARSEQLLAQSYATSNEWPSAVIHFQNALAATPDRRDLHAEMGEVLLRAGRTKQAKAEFEAELRGNGASLRALVRRGEVRLIEGDVDGALEDWGRAIEMDEPQAERILGIREDGFGDSALEQLSAEAKEKISLLASGLRARNTPAAHFALAFLAAQDGNPSQATEEGRLSAAASSVTKDEPCSQALVRSSLENGHFSEVARCAEKSLTPRTPPALRVRIASALFDAGEYEASLRILDGLAPANRHSPEASYVRARCYEKLATAAYLRLYQADPGSYRMHQLMGDLAAAKNDDAKAIEEYRAAIALKPALPNLHYSLGHLLWKDTKVPEARAELEAEVALDPRHAGALDDLGDTYLLEHQPEKALPYLQRALAVDGTNPDFHRDLGTANFELREYRKAEEQFKIAISGDRDGSVHYKLARVYQALGEKEDAAREFALSTALNRESHSKLEKQTQRLGEVARSASDQ
jgi:tetratricopeptide (TPR) repeat protein